MTKRLYRSRTNKVFAGVLGGLGEYFEVDPALLRLIFLLILILTGVVPGIVFYLLAIAVVAKQPIREA
jgi:phage shock protein PspC (stress-responsive transcriptional regulator)